MYNKDTILLVDDEEVIKRKLIDVISDEYNILDASNGKEALDILAENVGKVSVIVLDLIMPVMDGFQFMDEFKTHQEYANIPVIVATSNEDWRSEQKCLEAGVWDFVMKPYNPLLLRFRIKNAIEKSRMIIAEKDAVTGLYTKFKFYQEVRKMLLEVTDKTFAFIRLDIDRFKMINNFYGIKEGDRLLVNVARELDKISTTFENFVYGRLENDVFGLCMEYNEENIELVLNALQINVKKVNKDYNIKISCGVYVINDLDIDVSEMYDRAFLAAKNCKGNFTQSIAYYDDSMIENMRQEQFIINEVNKALEEEQFEVYLQPKINLVTDRPYGAEALVRWKHPDKGMISPGEFIPVYERNGIIGKLDLYMWRHVCVLLRKWIDEGRNPSPISVNVSRVNIYNPRLVDTFKNLLTEFQIPAGLLNLEITESAFMEDQELIVKTINKLHQLGFKIMMDDFGSGYSSLNVLKDMEIDYLKVDMKFLQQDVEFNGKGEKVLTSVIRMAKWLHLPSIVEGVETVEQVDFLKCIGCEYAQGFYYARPMPVDEYEKYIEKDDQVAISSNLEEKSIIVGELWNTRSNASVIFDMMDVPIAIYEYRNDKFELLRANTRFDNDIMFEKDCDESEYRGKLEEQRTFLTDMFSKIAKGDVCEPYEYNLTDDIWYRVTVKMVGMRADTCIMMATFTDISDYKQDY
jgi:diguanylate cyclase (GGDEF)-like protein